MMTKYNIVFIQYIMINISKCRPLLKTSFCEEYVDVPYSYTYEQINNLKVHLPKGIKFMGIDFVDGNHDAPKLKNKIIAVNSVAGGKLKFIKEFQVVGWQVCVVMRIPQISSNFDQCIHNAVKNVEIKGSKGQMNFKEIKQAKFFMKQLKQINNSGCKYLTANVPVKLLLPTKKTFEEGHLLNEVREDLQNALSIMIQNQLYFRIFKEIEKIPLQNYYQAEKDIQKDGKFLAIFEGMPQAPPAKKQPNQVGWLVGMLLSIVCLYVMMKMLM